MSILACGPFARVGRQDEEGSTAIRAPLRTQGDWVNLPEGQEALAAAKTKIMEAVADGRLPEGTRIEDQSKDLAVIVMPYASWQAAVDASAAVKALVPKITGAQVSDGIVMPPPKKK